MLVSLEGFEVCVCHTGWISGAFGEARCSAVVILLQGGVFVSETGRRWQRIDASEVIRDAARWLKENAPHLKDDLSMCTVGTECKFNIAWVVPDPASDFAVCLPQPLHVDILFVAVYTRLQLPVLLRMLPGRGSCCRPGFAY